MTKPRSSIVSLAATPYYHVVTRCVRRAYLCGIDTVTGKDFTHRRDIFEERLTLLQSVFAVDVAAYAIMSNHYHLVVHIDEKTAKSWDKDEVINRWRQIFCGPEHIQKYCKGEPLTEFELAVVDATADEWRTRLMNLSWFVRCLNEYMARLANEEDNCTGRFWEGRFKSQALLDEQALLSCMAYVDLNPVRACMAQTPEQSVYTSISKRIKAAKASMRPNEKAAQPANLLPFIGGERLNMPKGIQCDLTDYLELVDWSGRQIKANKRGSIEGWRPHILEQLGIRADKWVTLTLHFESKFKAFAGMRSALKTVEEILKLLGMPGIRSSRNVFC